MKDKKTTPGVIIFYLISFYVLFLLLAVMYAFGTSSRSDMNLILVAAIILMGLLMGVLMSLALQIKSSKESKDGDAMPEKAAKAEEEPDGLLEIKGAGTETVPTTDNSQYNLDIQDIQTSFLRIEERMNLEIKALGKRANLNLIIGSIVAVMGWLILAWYIWGINSSEYEGWSLLNVFVPRLAMVIMIEVYSFFFLKLYRESLDRIRYYHNEITNIELRKVALQTMCIEEVADEYKLTIVEKLLTTERNAFLKKGETTIELEKMRIDSAKESNILKILKDLGLNISNKATS